MLKIETKSMTIKDFIKLKKIKPFCDWRTTAKTINFSLLFGASARSFAGTLKNNGFSKEQCIEFLKLTNHTGDYNRAKLENSMGLSDEDILYLVVATLMRNSFFESYPGFASRIARERDFSLAHGYVRSFAGPVRHLPQLKYMKFNEKGNLIGADKQLYSKMCSHLINEAANSNIQTMETTSIFPAIHITEVNLINWNFKSFIFNTVHDSADFVIYDKEQDVVLSLYKKAAEKDREPISGIPMEVDCEISNLTDIDNEYYKHGGKVNIRPLEVTLKEYNEKYNTNLQYYDTGF